MLKVRRDESSSGRRWQRLRAALAVRALSSVSGSGALQWSTFSETKFHQGGTNILRRLCQRRHHRFKLIWRSAPAAWVSVPVGMTGFTQPFTALKTMPSAEKAAQRGCRASKIQKVLGWPRGCRLAHAFLQEGPEAHQYNAERASRPMHSHESTAIKRLKSASLWRPTQRPSQKVKFTGLP